MRFECRDLERALRTPELLPDAREHAANCPQCRRDLYLWSEISNLARGLHEEWETPELWSRIEQTLAAEKRATRRRPRSWQWLGAVAAALVLAVALWRPWRATQPAPPPSKEFLTEQTLREVELAEAAYVRSIDKLARLAEAKLAKDPSPLAASYREKLLLLDSAIADLKSNAEGNRYNATLRAELASLYKQKQQALQEVLSNEKSD